MRLLSLFAGVGGFDLALERAGMTCIGQVEKDKYCLRLLEKHCWLDLDPPLADSQKYKMMGNSVAVPVVEWIASRILRYAH